MKYEIKHYKNIPANDRFVRKAEAEGFEVYETNRKYVQMRKPLETSAGSGANGSEDAPAENDNE